MAAQDIFALEEDITFKIEKDHALVRSLYKDYQRQGVDPDFKKSVLDNIIKNIVQHSAAEEMVLYNEYKNLLQMEGGLIAENSWKEHEEVKKLLYKLDSISSKEDIINNPNVEILLNEIMTNLSSHMKEEEESYLPRLRKEVSRERLIELGKSFDNHKQMAAPTRPHPMAPDKGISGLMANVASKPLDELRDAMTDKRVD